MNVNYKLNYYYVCKYNLYNYVYMYVHMYLHSARFLFFFFKQIKERKEEGHGLNVFFLS